MDQQLNEWNRFFTNCGTEKPKYDDWLDKYQAYLEKSKDIPIIDLGCGFGNDTLYLTERGYQVISCDYSAEALNRLSSFIAKPDIRLFNILDGLPFEDNTACVLIADLSLHYFSWEATNTIIENISKVLVSDGYLFSRVNSVKDINHGAGQGIKIEENFFSVDGKLKRFFDREQITEIFKTWEVINISEYEMNRYQESKIVWEIAMQNKKG